ncbi:MAG: hypothetical protein KDB63_08295 [Nocardioidaceae bacterium]|nr:hypothetical protein [Nocardioidaceae bacterium]
MLLLVLAVALAGLAVPSAAGSSAPASRRTADQPRTGYVLRHDGTAAGGWIGSRKLGGVAVFRLDPGRAPVATSFGRAHWVSVLDGSGPVNVDRGRTRRAAWILAKYGVYRSKAQAAAVEVALDSLLVGGRWAVTGAVTRRRLDQTDDPPTILGLADFMLTNSRLLAGPYRVTVQAEDAIIGRQVLVTVRVTAARSDEPVPSLPVEVVLAGHEGSGRTDDTGTADIAIRSTRSGPQDVAVTVRLLPSDRLLVRRPAGRGSRVVVAGKKHSTEATAPVAVQAKPVARIATPANGRVTDPVPGTLQLTGGYASSRSAALTLHGPLPAGSPADCTPATVLGSVHPMPVAADGGYGVPRVVVAVPGVYSWDAAVAGDRFNLPAVTCGPPVTVKAVPRLSIEPTKDRIAVGGSLRGRITVAALDDGYADVARARLFGPFDTRADARCTDARQVRNRGVTVTGPVSTGTTDVITLNRAGVYAWRAALPRGPLALHAATTCGAPGTFVTVR